ncbi:MAG: hypothetical protein EON88_36755 [Brevundimonas sp.]|nr:MAG: hypothetical protein EON88_36755 [Brevundimonas sp.]
MAPSSATVLFQTGYALWRLRREFEALDFLRRALEAEDATARMHARFIALLIQADRIDEAQGQLRAAELLFPGDATLAGVRDRGFQRLDPDQAAA